jgi:mycothiol synthase
MSQLFMRRPNLAGLPALPPLPSGYEWRELREDALDLVSALMTVAFEDESWTAERVHREFMASPDVRKTFVIVWGERAVASASVQIPEKSPETGYLHWVAADPEHRGRRLGYIVSLAVLHELARHGCRDAALLTDDPRLPAIKTYLNLGFLPEHRDETHPARWEAVTALLAEKRL